MMSSTLGAPFGGTTRGAHQAFDSEAFSLITPPNFGSGGGNCLPSMVVVAPGEPGIPVVCWAVAGTTVSRKDRHAIAHHENLKFEEVLVKNNTILPLS